MVVRSHSHVVRRRFPFRFNVSPPQAKNWSGFRIHIRCRLRDFSSLGPKKVMRQPQFRREDQQYHDGKHHKDVNPLDSTPPGPLLIREARVSAHGSTVRTQCPRPART